MVAFKLTIFLTILSLLSCNYTNKQIITTWYNGKPKLERHYSDTPNCFIEKEYYENGQLASETKYLNSTKNGESIAFYKDGKLLGKCSYRNGQINGEVIEFHKTGNVMFKGNQIDGNLVGTATHNYDNGRPERELYYKENKVFLVNYWNILGVQKINNGNGIRKFQDCIVKDKNGNDITLNVLVVGTYKDSLYNGPWKYYSLVTNKLILERNFKDNKIISETWK